MQNLFESYSIFKTDALEFCHVYKVAAANKIVQNIASKNCPMSTEW